mmetsp:Transcript_22780/g.17213  ORF Transcript_22780/g.17213 Transcript_22780/m.17213 type:complete len:89 (+) Transcript_22780:614-880(+)
MFMPPFYSHDFIVDELVPLFELFQSLLDDSIVGLRADEVEVGYDHVYWVTYAANNGVRRVRFVVRDAEGEVSLVYPTSLVNDPLPLQP